MLLVIDVGNTNMVFGIYAGEQLAGSFRLKTDVNRTSDEIGLLAFQYFEKFELDTSEIEDVIIASVVPPVMYSLTSAIVKYFNCRPLNLFRSVLLILSGLFTVVGMAFFWDFFGYASLSNVEILITVCVAEISFPLMLLLTRLFEKIEIK